MSPELDDALCRAHPEMFADRHSDMRITAMCWGFECGDGWYDLLSSLCELISWPHLQAKQAYEELQKSVGSAQYEGGPIVTEAKVERARQAMLAAARALPRVRQVKEKFGALRVYLGREDPRISALVEFAEYHSSKVCEQCGAPGTLRTDGWMRTLCDAHEAERAK
jgi:hypothetical protein